MGAAALVFSVAALAAAQTTSEEWGLGIADRLEPLLPIARRLLEQVDFAALSKFLAP